MNALDLAVEKTIKDFMDRQVLFTALDISNAVKNDHSLSCRHKEVRDIVRRFYSDNLMVGYARDSITVTLSNGSDTQAMLYYPDVLSFSDIDSSYGSDKRSQVAIKPTVVATKTSAPLTTSQMIMKPKLLAAYLAQKVNGFMSNTPAANSSSDLTDSNDSD